MSYVLNTARSHVAIALVIALTCATCIACAPRDTYDFPNTLGVLPPQKPIPLWLGTVRGTANAESGAASVSPSPTPGWEHVLLSIDDSQAGTTYSWSLRSGSCSSQGSIVGPADRYAAFTTRADGSGAVEAVVPAMLSPAASYAVVATPVSSAAIGSSSAAGSTGTACADLTLGSM